MRRFIKILCIAVLSLYLLGCSNKPSRDYVLYDFENPVDLDELEWHCHTMYSLSDMHATHGSKSLQLDLFPSPYPGFSPILKKTDWSAYTGISFDVYNPEKVNIPMSIRIDDRKYPEYTDRYNKRLILQPGMNHFDIPFDSLITSGTQRKLEMKTISNFILFSADPAKKLTLYIDYIRLVRETGR